MKREFCLHSSRYKKIVVVGAGYVGSSIAYALTLRNLAQRIILIDIDPQKAWGEATDIQHGISCIGDSSVIAGDYSDCVDSDLIIVTAGRNRRPGETRLDMIADNTKIMQTVIQEIKKNYTRGVILVVSNPVDIMVALCDRWLDLPKGRVFGTGCVLDTSRMIRIVADYLGVSTYQVGGYVVGEHGDSQIPLWSHLMIDGVPANAYCQSRGIPWGPSEQKLIADKVKNLGASIISAKGKTHYGIATCVCYIADAVLNNRQTAISVCTPLSGEYGVSSVSLSVPSIVGTNGIEQQLKMQWADDELLAFQDSALRLKEFIKYS